jgi:hypothetical protein
MRARVWTEGALAIATAVLAAATAISAEWIEWVTGLDPDGGSGALERGLVVALAAGAVALGVTAGRDFRRWRVNADAV